MNRSPTLVARSDIMVLSLDDLATLSNRGLVKRASQELQSGEMIGEISQDESGDITVNWSDQVTCRLPGSHSVSFATCTCPAGTICRHIVRSVLAYQVEMQRDTPEGQEQDNAAAEPWNPAIFTDDDLAQAIPARTLARSRKLYSLGQVVEVHVSRRPLAIFHTLPCTVRFLVPGDIRYSHCDCSEESPCIHVALAALSFRLLPAEVRSGVVQTNPAQQVVPESTILAVESALNELVTLGASAVPVYFLDKLRRLEKLCLANGLVWPAMAISELAQQCDSYQTSDARFSPRTVTELVGELCIRLDAVRYEDPTEAIGTIPQLFVRGSIADTLVPMKAARLIGLGTNAAVIKGATEITAYIHDTTNGKTLAVSRIFPDPSPTAGVSARSFRSLASTTGIGSFSLAAVGSGQVLASGGKRTADGRFLAGRASVSVQPQDFRWEALSATVLVEDFAELRERLSSSIPRSLAPRNLARNFFVCPISKSSETQFDESGQATYCELTDNSGGTAVLKLDYFSRGASGTNCLVRTLKKHANKLCFVAGRVGVSHGELMIRPVALVYTEDGIRKIIQPWIGTHEAEAPKSEVENHDVKSQHANENLQPHGGKEHPWNTFFRRIAECVDEIILLGLSRNASTVSVSLSALIEDGTALGFHAISRPLQLLAKRLESQRHTRDIEWSSAAAFVLELTVLLEFLGEKSSAHTVTAAPFVSLQKPKAG